MPTKQKRAILLIQLGSPVKATPQALKDYLISFLGDPHTLGNPPFFWNALLRNIIAPLRAKASAKKYLEMLKAHQISEMPLITHTQNFSQGVQKELGPDTLVLHAFQHGAKPSIKDALDEFTKQGFHHIQTIPLYPQRSEATSTAAIHQLQTELEAYPHLKAQVAEAFFEHPAWVECISQSIQARHKANQQILISWHGMDQKRIDAGDFYESDCKKSVLAIQKHIPSTILVAYQSRFGFAKWLGPSTLSILKKLASQKASVLVVCPAFTVDNLETLHEIEIEAKDYFLKNGGRSFEMVPCLNADPKWVSVFSHKILADLKWKDI